MVKLAISATDNKVDSVVCPTFGRCPGFLIVEIEKDKIKNKKFVENPGMKMFRGAGISAAQLVAGEKCSAIITGNIGPNSWSVIQSSGIKIYSAVGLKVKDALEQYSKGKLKEFTQSNVSGGWGGRGTGRGMGQGMGRGAGAGRGGRWQ
jgi:predicted Fe-Mo cluster-binding NifX family protein